jgi:hypothetical protein
VNVKRTIVVLAFLAISIGILSGQVQLTAAQKTKVEALLKEYKAWGADVTVVKAVAEYNAAPPADYASMTQEKWAALSILSPEVKYFSKTPLAEYLKAKRTDAMTELFVSGADGKKIAFFSKTTSWSHKGKPKHDDPMAGKTWIGAVEVDESTGKQQVQISFPVLDGAKPVGSIVIGLDLAKL